MNMLQQTRRVTSSMQNKNKMRRSNRIKASLPRLTEFHIGADVRDENLDHALKGKIIEVLYDSCLIEWKMEMLTTLIAALSVI